MAWSTEAAAQSAADEGARAEAVELFDRGVEAYRRGHFPEAADLFRAAHARTGEPILVYNLARALENAGELEGAAQAYRQYLDAQIAASERPGIEARIEALERRIAERRELEAALAERARASDQGEAPSTAAPELTERGPGLAPWILGGAGLAAAVAGTAFAIVATRTHAAADDEVVNRRALELEDRAGLFATLANVGWIGGGVLMAAGAIWLLVANGGAADARAPSAALAPGPAGSGLRIRF